MNFVLQNALISLSIAAGMLILMAVGRRRGALRLAADPKNARSGLGVIDGSVFALLGLVLAFTFNGAGQRFAERRTNMGHERVAIEEGWLKIDVLPPETQPALRVLYKRYLDERIAAYTAMPDEAAVHAHFAVADTIRHEIWRQAVAATSTPEGLPARLMMLTAVDQLMKSYEQSWVLMLQHPPSILFVVLAVLMLTTAMLIGEGMAEAKRPSRTHTVGLVVLLTGLFFVILDLENPLSGLIQLDKSTGAYTHLRHSFGP